MRLERVLSTVISVVFALVLSLIIGFLSAIAWFQLGGRNSGGICGSVAGFASFVLIVWKSDFIFQKLLDAMRKFPEPFRSSLEFGIVGGLLFGGVMLVGILFLGHTRPIGWDFNRVLPSTGLGFTLFVIGGLLVGTFRKRRRDSSTQ